MGESLARHTTLGLGGPAGTWTNAASELALVDAVRDSGDDLFILGGGSNVVVADKGFSGAVVKVATRGLERFDDVSTVILTVQAGEVWDDVCAFAVAEGLAGIECLSGIPGTAGAAPIQNIGAYGREVADSLVGVRAFDRGRDEVIELEAEKCGFAYRMSRFKRCPGRFVILAISLRLEPGGSSWPIRHPAVARELDVSIGDTVPLARVRRAVLSLRRAKGMVLDPGDPDTTSTGSFFVNPLLSAEEFGELEARIESQGGGLIGPIPHEREADKVKVHAAWLIEKAGFKKGYGKSGTVAISSKHALALTHLGKGTTADLVSLAEEIAAVVRERFGITLVPEPIFVGHDWEPPC
ncbi:MAG TPA: UDP-N-acetylmuramate dehydrogenase [Solirubrobacterales bacterium]|nr:UDP-N-acetylmuramate dehydrogenase [Solirubrobacterales bacterium]